MRHNEFSHFPQAIANVTNCKSSSSVTAFEARYLTNFESVELDTSSLVMDISNPSEYECSYSAASGTHLAEESLHSLAITQHS